MGLQLQCPFLGSPLSSSLNGRKHAIFLYSGRGHLSRRPSRKCMCANKHNDWITQAIRFSNFCSKYFVFLRNAIGRRNGLKVECVKEPYAQRKALIKSFDPLWKEELLLFRGSIFVVVISGVYLLVWYGQTKTKSYIETKLLPSVCSVLSDYIQHEIDFVKVRRVSPPSITLESCSFGPHGEEFSCGEIPTMRLQLRPLASLRRGKIVIDAVLSHPSVVIVQKKDYSWLDIPSSEDGLQRRLSTEDGIDYRTKIRRGSREELAASWAKERDNNAKEAAKRSYIVPEGDFYLSEDEVWKEDLIDSANLTNYKTFSCMDENMHWRDHHCMDTGLDYAMKHADLEKSFGVKFPGSVLKFWSGVIKGPNKWKFKRKSNGSDISATEVNAKKRILERSASAAVGDNEDISIDVNSGEECFNADNQNGEHNEKSEIQPLKANQHSFRHTYHFNLIRYPFLITLGRLLEVAEVGENLPSGRNVAGDAKTNSVNSEDFSVDLVNRNTDALSEIKNGHASQNYATEKVEPGPGINHPG